MSTELLGQLIPIGGGDSIPLLRETMTIGRRKSNDIALEFPNVSSQHCELIFQKGVWNIRDLRSQNGTKVNGERVVQKLVKPGDTIAIANHQFKLDYLLSASAQSLVEQSADEEENVFSQSLMEKAGLERRPGERGSR